MDGFEQSPLYRIMHPASVAFWGASSNPMGMGSVQLNWGCEEDASGTSIGAGIPNV